MKGDITMNHVSIGVYNSDEYVVNIVRPEDLEDHIWYNKTFRFGRALFVDGKCIHKGYLDNDKIKQWEEKLKGWEFQIKYPSEVYK
jgi:hypothetical protein